MAGMNDLGLKIGGLELDLKVVLAPLAGVTNTPFRLMARQQGAGLVTTEMVSAAGLVKGGWKTLRLMARDEAERPLAVQLFGARADWLAEAAAIAQGQGADVVDLNMGCPVRKVVRHGAGAALLKDFELALGIVRAMRARLSVPFTVKTRLGWSPGVGEIAGLLAPLAEEGVDALCLHGRYASQGFRGQADWAAIACAVGQAKMPLIANGDVRHGPAAADMLEKTGAAGVMIGRGALGNPWIFRDARLALRRRPIPGVGIEERFATARRHMLMLGQNVGQENAVYMLRSVLMWYTKGLPGSAGFRGSLNQITDFSQVLDLLAGYERELAGQETEAEAVS